MAEFDFHTAFREIKGYEIDNLIGVTATVYPITESNNVQGRDTSTFGDAVSEVVHIKTMSEEHQRLIEGEWDSEDLVITAKYNTAINMHAKIVYPVGGNIHYIVQKIDDVRMDGNVVFKRFYCKRQHTA